jgi:hypothetical protein
MLGVSKCLTRAGQDQWLASVFALPVVANGSVYVPTFDSGVLVYHP